MLETFLAVWFTIMAVVFGLWAVLAAREVRQKINDIKQGGTGWDTNE